MGREREGGSGVGGLLRCGFIYTSLTFFRGVVCSLIFFIVILLENSSLVAESERDHSTLRISGTGGSISGNKNRTSRVQIPKGNFYINSPFKQGPEKDVKGPTLVRVREKTMCVVQ